MTTMTFIVILLFVCFTVGAFMRAIDKNCLTLACLFGGQLLAVVYILNCVMG